MTFLQMKTRLAVRRGAVSATIGTANDTRYGYGINETYRSILRKPWASRLRDTTTTVPSVNGTATYSITSCARINRVWETTNQRKLEYRTLAWLRATDPLPTTGTPSFWIPTDLTKTTQSFILYPTPTAAITYTLDITSSLTELTADADVPLLPDDFHDLLIDGAELKELKKEDDPGRWSMVKSTFDQGLKDLQGWLNGNPDWTPPIGDQPMHGISTLGAWFPADSRLG